MHIASYSNLTTKTIKQVASCFFDPPMRISIEGKINICTCTVSLYLKRWNMTVLKCKCPYRFA